MFACVCVCARVIYACMRLTERGLPVPPPLPHIMPTPVVCQIPQLEQEALETLMSANVSEHHERKEDLDQMKKRCCGVCTPAEHEW